MKRFFLPLIALFTLSASLLSAQGFYVSLEGSDDNPGTKAKPFRSLAAARDAVRKVNRDMDGDIVVYLGGGVYPISETVKFGPEDSGFNGHKVIYRAAEGEKPILTGGVAVTGWKLHDKDKNIYRAPAPKTVFRQVYINDKPGVRARTPNRESETTFGPYLRLEVPKKPECHIVKKDWSAVEGVRRLDEVELVIETHWYHQRIRIGKHRETDDGVVVLPVAPAGKMSKKLGFYRVSYFFFENALEFIDTPDEWYHDPRAGFLYMAVDKGTDPNKQRVEVPVTSTLLAIRGTADKPVENIEFDGLTFQCSNWDSPSRLGLNVTQFVQPMAVKRSWESSDYPMGIVRAAHARRIAFRNNTIRNAGANGIQFYMNVDDSDIEGNHIYQIAANGIEIDAYAAKNPPPERQSTGVAVWNNHIHKAGQNYTNGGGLLAHNVRGLIVEHNHIHDMPYSGMQIGNQPGGMRDIGCGDNRVRYNHVHHCLQLHDDGGGIYTLGGIQRGSIIAENYLHDIVTSKWAGNYPIDLIYLDNYTSKILVKDNVVNGGRAAERNRSAGNTLVNNSQSNPNVENDAGIKPGYELRGE
ncbi:MAG: right-handed parallel beta-helix repeat-containing protein [Pirellulales bacterium]|nr:right-handed parallel beta-helix repeat-containing protein [Pirellulales bacterium]